MAPGEGSQVPGRVNGCTPSSGRGCWSPEPQQSASAVKGRGPRQGPAAAPAGAASSREQEWTTGPAEIRASQGSALRSCGEGKDGPQGRSGRGLQEGRCPRVAWMGSQTGQGADMATHKPNPAAVGGGLGAGGSGDSPGGLEAGELGSRGLGASLAGQWGLGPPFSSANRSPQRQVGSGLSAPERPSINPAHRLTAAADSPRCLH